MDGYWCECLPGYTGINCETKINECEHQPCGPNGNCLDLVNEFKCNCYPGYTGATCKENINECITLSPCTHQSKCIDLKPDYTNGNKNTAELALNQQTDNSTWTYYCDCNDLNMQLFKMNQNKHVMYTGMNCSVELNACQTKKHMCLHESTCESVLIDQVNNHHGIKCVCKPGFTGQYCEILTTIRLDGSYSPKPVLVSSNENEFHLKFEFRIQSAQLYAAKKNGFGVPIFYAEKIANKSVLSNQSLLLFKLNAFPKFLNVWNKQLNLNEKIAFYESDNAWHSLEISKQSPDNLIKLVYSVETLGLTQTKLIKLTATDLLSKESEFISIRFGKVYHKTEEYSSTMCLRDVMLNEKHVFMSSRPDTDVKYGCNLIKNECEANESSNYCEHGSKCSYKWFSNDCSECEYPFYGERCQLGLLYF